MREIRADATLEVRPAVKASIAIRDIADAFSFGGPRPTPTGRWRSPYRPDTFIQGCAFAQKRRPFRLSYKHGDRRKRGDGNQTKGTDDEHSREDRDFRIADHRLHQCRRRRFAPPPHEHPNFFGLGGH